MGVGPSVRWTLGKTQASLQHHSLALEYISSDSILRPTQSVASIDPSPYGRTRFSSVSRVLAAPRNSEEKESKARQRKRRRLEPFAQALSFLGLYRKGEVALAFRKGKATQKRRCGCFEHFLPVTRKYVRQVQLTCPAFKCPMTSATCSSSLCRLNDRCYAHASRTFQPRRGGEDPARFPTLFPFQNTRERKSRTLPGFIHEAAECGTSQR